MQALDLDVQRPRSLRAIRACLLELKWLRATMRLELALRRHHRALRYAEKAGFNPDQPRDWHGRWTDGGGSGPSDGRIRLAGDIPTGDSPEPPEERPATSKERTSALKLAARLLVQATDSAATVFDTVALFAKLGAWYQTRSAEIESYNDPPKSLDELQQATSKPAPGYDIHHIVEQTQAEHEGYPRELIDSPDNLVRIPRLKHQEINAWYQTKNDEFEGPTPRQYLSGRNWDLKRAVGLQALKLYGVLKP